METFIERDFDVSDATQRGVYVSVYLVRIKERICIKLIKLDRALYSKAFLKDFISYLRKHFLIDTTRGYTIL